MHITRNKYYKENMRVSFLNSF